MHNEGLQESEYLNTIFRFSYLTQEFISTPFVNYVKKTNGWTVLQFRAICIMKRAGRISMSKFAEQLLITRQQATQLTNSLVEHGLAIRDHSSENRRNVFIMPSELAVKQLIEAEEGFSRMMRDRIIGLPDGLGDVAYQSMETIADILDRIQNHELPWSDDKF